MMRGIAEPDVFDHLVSFSNNAPTITWGYTDRIAFAHFALQWDQWAKGFGRSGVVVFGRVLFLLVVGPMIC